MATNNVAHSSRVDEWRSRLLLTVGGLLLAETLTGLSIWLLPFSVSNQVVVLLHTVVGLALLGPFGWYQLRHWLRYRRIAVSHQVLTGYFAMAATLTALFSGLVLTWQAVFGMRIGYGWDLAHIIATFGLVAASLPHLVVPVLRARTASLRGAEGATLAAQRRFAVGATLLAAIVLSLVGLAWAYRPTPLNNRFPEDYSYLYGKDRPFAPSLAATSTGGAIDARILAGSESCGRGGCHQQILREWQASAHRYSAMDVAFQKVQSVMAQQNGPESTRYCGGCHDPISLFSGAKTVFTSELTNEAGYQEGVSCIVCHAIKKVDVQGNAAYVLVPPERYMFELRSGAAPRFLSGFLIRAYPRHHKETLEHTLFKSPEFCGACHKQFIDEQINQVGWVQLQNQYDNWRKSRWNHQPDPTKTTECRECHMPLLETGDPSSGDDHDYNRTAADGKHRSHRFLAGNQMMPLVLKLPGAEEQVRLTEEWLQGKIPIPEIAEKWKPGTAIPIELRVPEEVRPGQVIQMRVSITNNKAGHEFPTGPLDIIQAWLHVTVRDQDGELVFESGGRDARHFIQPGSFIFKAEPVDQYGNLIDRHNLWEMVGVRYKRAVFPGFSDEAELSFEAPSAHGASRPALNSTPVVPRGGRSATGAAGVQELHVSAQLMYRKFDQFLLNYLFGEDAGITAPATVLSADTATIRVVPAVPGRRLSRTRHSPGSQATVGIVPGAME